MFDFINFYFIKDRGWWWYLVSGCQDNISTRQTLFSYFFIQKKRKTDKKNF